MNLTQWEQKKKWRSLRDLWHNIKGTNIHTLGVSKGEEREKGEEKLFEEIMAKNFPNMEKETHIHIQEEWRVPNKNEFIDTQNKT